MKLQLINWVGFIILLTVQIDLFANQIEADGKVISKINQINDFYYQKAMTLLNRSTFKPNDIQQGIDCLKIAANQQHYPSQYTLALWSIHQPDLLPTHQAIHYLTTAAKAGDTKAKFYLAQKILQSPNPHLDRIGFYWMQMAAQELPDAQYLLANLYLHGIGIQANRGQAVQLLNKLANEDFTQAQLSLGQLYLRGHGVPYSLSKARFWLNKAHQKGAPEANTWLQLLNWAQDPQQTLVTNLLIEKAQREDPMAQYHLALKYLNGSDEIAQDIDIAQSLLIKAATNNLLEAQLSLASLYSEGKILQQNINQVQYWYLQAAKQDNDKAKFELSKLYYQLGDEKNLSKAYGWLCRIHEPSDEMLDLQDKVLAIISQEKLENIESLIIDN